MKKKLTLLRQLGFTYCSWVLAELVSPGQLAVAAGPQEVQGQMSAGKGTSV